MSNDNDIRPFRLDMPEEALADCVAGSRPRDGPPTWEEPEFFATEVRTAFRSLQKS